ncbi:CA [Mytilus coruscus]|uniref:CA n=1 Tax=Mytilus coruscus TaxID=42192 RepID=A0A6J8B220_MYTCO|nr:CA [Mytilus coruscus]
MIFAAFLASEAIIQSSEDDQEVLLLTLDAEKAFDKLEHEILFNKVYHYGIDGDMWILLRNMYREMSIRIKWDDLVSDKISVNQGIQQGAKLSTSLYKCYNNAILDSVTESGLGCHMGTIGIATPTCADDILVLANSEYDEVDVTNVLVSDLIIPKLDKYYRYKGSLTTPPCYESVTWTMFEETIPISENQLRLFRNLKENKPNHKIVNNFRPVQQLNGRRVSRSFKLETDGANTICSLSIVTVLLVCLLHLL